MKYKFLVWYPVLSENIDSNKMQKLHLLDGWIKEAIKIPSPNFNHRPVNTQINTLIIHAISLPPGEFGGNDIDKLFCNTLNIKKHPAYQSLQGLKVSAHFLIRRNGGLHQYVSTENRAWHAGISEWHGVPDCNNYSIGIELEGSDNKPFMAVQYRQLALLCHCLMHNYPLIDTDTIIGHSDVAPGRKSDPGVHFLWSHFFALLDTI